MRGFFWQALLRETICFPSLWWWKSVLRDLSQGSLKFQIQTAIVQSELPVVSISNLNKQQTARQILPPNLDLFSCFFVYGFCHGIHYQTNMSENMFGIHFQGVLFVPFQSHFESRISAVLRGWNKCGSVICTLGCWWEKFTEYLIVLGVLEGTNHPESPKKNATFHFCFIQIWVLIFFPTEGHEIECLWIDVPIYLCFFF